jgi:ABC-type polysaccharide/polyol phosphate export permease
MVVKKTLISLYQYRELLWNFTKRDVTARYSGTFFGIFWSFFNPLILFLVYAAVFGFFLKVRLPGSDSIIDFILYFSIGFFPWTFFSSALMRTSTAILDNRNYIKKVPFPAEIFPCSVILSELFTLSIGLGMLMVLILFTKGISVSIFFLPVVFLLQAVLTYSFGLFLSAVTVYVRDISQILNSFLMVWFWITPIVYPVEAIPVKIKTIISFNPMFQIVNFYRDILFYDKISDAWRWIIFTVCVAVIFFLCVLVFQKARLKFSELL